ncbi:Nudix hydrolase 22, chloroplastic [Capsicum annuum]|uniref:Nudix hydrolase 22, chloroplastic n=1 Tax=Capsicum annuum TaxID=4072 RepID=A0A2G2YJE0_CAPAN|nr:Nudix hydrolase 22, chloroplastic [Capsicum annuum]
MTTKNHTLNWRIEPQNLRGGEGRINTDVLWIPLEASKYFSIGPAPVTISHCGSGKSYHAKVFYEHRDRRKIYDGWRDFIRDGVIREGDVLVFLITYSEVSLPGGKVEEGDANDIETALREAEEEIGLDRSLVDVVTVLESFTGRVCVLSTFPRHHLWDYTGNAAVSLLRLVYCFSQKGITVIPVVGILWDRNTFNPKINTAEVAAIFDAPLEMFLKDENRREKELEYMGEKCVLHFFDHETENGKYIIWALTAAILIKAASTVYQRPPGTYGQFPVDVFAASEPYLMLHLNNGASSVATDIQERNMNPNRPVLRVYMVEKMRENENQNVEEEKEDFFDDRLDDLDMNITDDDQTPIPVDATNTITSWAKILTPRQRSSVNISGVVSSMAKAFNKAYGQSTPYGFGCPGQLLEGIYGHGDCQGPR